MKATLISLSPSAASAYTSSDGLLEIDIPAGAITSADQASAGGKLALRIEQIAPGSGGNAGGSGLVSLGTYLLQVVDADGYLATTGLRRPIQARFHYPARAGAYDLSQLKLIINASTPEGIVAALPHPASVSPGRAAQTGTMGGAPTGVISGAAPGLGAPGAQATTLDASARTLSAPLALSSPTTSISWDTSVSVATFGKPDPFSEDLSGGALTTSIPLDIPAGPGGLTPPLALAYSSASVAEQHNPQAAAGWLGEG